MRLETKTLRESINKAFLKETVDRSSFNRFKSQLRQLLDHIHSAEKKDEHEEHFKNFLVTFFNEVGFKDYYINTSVRIDLAIHIDGKVKDPVGVLIEAKRPSNKSEMISDADLNRKAMHEAVLYYLSQRLEDENTDLKHIIITDMLNWFVFDAQEFERVFYKPSELKNSFKSWKSDQKVSSNNDFMYNEIGTFIDRQDQALRGLYFDLRDYSDLLDAKVGSDHEKKLIPLFKLFSPIHLLKEPFANDSNTLNREFYRELLYILGLEETKEGSTRYIKRVSDEYKQTGSLIENTIRILDAGSHLSSVREPEVRYGEDRGDQQFNVAMELCITWVNRILFLKLLEAQLYRYHRKAAKFRFLNFKTIDGYDELNKLFFQVLARRESERNDDVNETFGHIPYLNSSLFDPTELEHEAVFISNLDDKITITVYNRSVLADLRGEEMNTLDYLFRFLDAYDFSIEGGEEIQQERKTLINASVLGLIFEKINGYKDGSFFTPGFITEYMARETLRKAVIDKFTVYLEDGSEKSPFEGGARAKAGAGDGTHLDHTGDDRDAHSLQEHVLTEIYNAIGRDISIKKANEIVNGITICDPAVGSGHFLVSCLNELLAIKSELGILCDREGKRMRNVNVEVENDELIVTWGDDELFEYDVATTWHGHTLAERKIAPGRQRIQKALFHEKRHIIENCLFGVDINPNSVKICRLRLWIELLKNTYYTDRSGHRELEVLPNIDINIKTGNSLVSRFELDSDLSSVFKDSEHSLDDYKEAVQNYKHTGDREEKQRLQKLIDDIKEDYSTTLVNNRPINKKLSKQRGRLEVMQNADLFGDKKFTKKEIKKQEQKVRKLEEQKAEEESGAFYNRAFEWRFEFPEVLDEEGQFIGFDVVIGNPPYLLIQNLDDDLLISYYRNNYKTAKYKSDAFSLFIEKAIILARKEGRLSLIVPYTWLSIQQHEYTRELILNHRLDSIIDLPHKVFESSDLDTTIIFIEKSNNTDDILIGQVENNGIEIVKDLNVSFIKRNDDLSINLFLSSKDFEILEKIESKSVELETLFKVSQGYIPYRRSDLIKEYGEEKGNQIVDERLWHAKEKKGPGYKQEIQGRDLNRFTHGESQQYVKYGKHVAGYVDEKFFKSPRVLIMEITRGDYYRITAAYTEKEMYNTPSIINVIDRENNKEKLLYLLGLLNSRLFTWYHEKRHSKAHAKTSIPKILVREVRALPVVPKIDNIVSKLVKNIIETKNKNIKSDTSELEAEIDRLVYELYGLTEEEIDIVEENSR